MEKIDFRVTDETQFKNKIFQFKQQYQTCEQDINSLFISLNEAIDHYHQYRQLDKIIELEELKLEIAVQEKDEKELDFVLNLIRTLSLLCRPQDLARIITIGKEYLSRSLSLPVEISLLQSLLGAALPLYGVVDEFRLYYDRYKAALSQVSALIEKHEENIEYIDFYKTIAVGMILFYFEDMPRINRTLRFHLASLATRSIRSIFAEEIEVYENNIKDRICKPRHNYGVKPLKIGYMSDYICQHSVGWLLRWTLQYHNPDRFEIYTYSTYDPKDFLHDRFINQYGDHVRHIPHPIKNISEQIQADEIDILVDLGSLTEFTTCVVSAIKPAPVQLTWLGMDASGIPTVDYYIADRFSLPDDAQDYYCEKLLKMPHCYIAVDGFEVDRPSISRTDFGIPDDAVIYLSSQGGAKRHPDNMKLQANILAQVPNSYLFIKGMKTDETVIFNSFADLANSMGIDSDRIKIIPATKKEETHRANLRIADVILDTYPYNGATTTLEALWCEVPLVTRVGQQFAARNSYSMLMNAGVTEGIAWTDDDYVNWGVMFGLNRDLRDRVRWKLRQSKRTSPLWDARQFTRDLEAVYQQIWDRYLEGITTSHSRTKLKPTP